jgi:hypothetical protein
MKKFLLIIALIITSETINAQISINQSKTIGVIKNGSDDDAKLTMSGNNITLTIMGIDVNKQWSTQSIRFTGTENDLNSLYEAIISVFSPENKKNGDYSLEITLGSDLVRIENKKLMGSPYVVIGVPGRFNSRQLTKGQIDKLFGK